jgi:hypothetical protein
VGSWSEKRIDKIKRNTRFVGQYKRKSKEINENNGEHLTSFVGLWIFGGKGRRGRSTVEE